jgi:hypothetical protein
MVEYELAQSLDPKNERMADAFYFNRQFDRAIELYRSQAQASPANPALGVSAFGLGPALPGFGTEIQVNNRVLALQEIHTFSPNTVNEFRLGYNFIRSNEVPREPLHDTDLPINRTSAAEFPGLPLFILQSGSGASFGTNEILLRGISPSLSVMDSVSLQRGRH